MRDNENYSLLPNNTSQQILMLLDKNIKSYFELLRKWKKNNKSLNGCPKFPKFKDKIKGRNILVFTSNQFKIKRNEVHFPKKTKLKPIKTRVFESKIAHVRIVPQSDSYKIEIVYEKAEKECIKIEKWSSIDLGLNNLAVIALEKPIIINGRPLKSINQYYNKQRAKIQSQLEKNHGKKSSRKLTRLTSKRNNKIEDYLHKSSRIVVDCLVKNNVSDLVVGYNKEWKQDINIGKRNNQNFVQIPFYKYIQMLEYKCKLEGIGFHTREESYTSKCSALDREEVRKHDTYLGRRVKRGMFKSSKGIRINADLNGALNILRKETGDKAEAILQTLSSRGQVVWPATVNLC